MDDDKANVDLYEGLPKSSTGVVEQAKLSIMPIGVKEADGEGSVTGELSMECMENSKSMPVTDFQSLLHRQTEVANAVSNQEKSSWKMLNMITSLTKVIADQEQVILSLQQERTGAERMTAEIAMDLRSQYLEISKLKQRYNVAEEQLSAVKHNVHSLQDEIKYKDELLADKEATIQELKEKLSKSEAQNSQKKQASGSGTTQIRYDREERLAEIRSILSRSDKGETIRARPTPRIEALRAARDSRLQQVRGMLENSPTTVSPKQTKLIHQSIRYDNIEKERSVSYTSEESMSDISSMDSFSDNNNNNNNNHEQRHRLYDALVRQRQQLREMP